MTATGVDVTARPKPTSAVYPSVWVWDVLGELSFSASVLSNLYHFNISDNAGWYESAFLII